MTETNTNNTAAATVFNFPTLLSTVVVTDFSNRVCDNWNRVPEYSVTSTSLNMFKNKPDHHL